MSFIIVAMLLPAISSIMAYIAYKYPFKKRGGAITKAGRFFGWLVLLSVIAGIYLAWETYSGNNTDKLSKDSLKNEIHDIKKSIKSIGYEFNESTRKIVAISNPTNNNNKSIAKTLSYKISPIMDITQRPVFIDYKSDSLKLIIHFGVINDAVSYNIRDKVYLFNLIDKKLIKVLETKRAISENTMSSPHIGQNITFIVPINKLDSKIDTAVIFFKLTYSNQPTGGKDIYFRNFFYFTNNTIFPKSKKDFSEINPTGQDTYLYYKKQLITSKYW